MNIGKAIKHYRIQRGLSQAELAELAVLSVSYVSLLERGKRDPTLSTVEVIASTLDIPLIALVFMASSDDELAKLDEVLREKLAHAALQITRN